jgi:hypothetical protein
MMASGTWMSGVVEEAAVVLGQAAILVHALAVVREQHDGGVFAQAPRRQPRPQAADGPVDHADHGPVLLGPVVWGHAVVVGDHRGGVAGQLVVLVHVEVVRPDEEGPARGLLPVIDEGQRVVGGAVGAGLGGAALVAVGVDDVDGLVAAGQQGAPGRA